MDQKAPVEPNYRISPSDLTYLYNSCKRCFYDKTKHQFKPPMNFSEHFTNADRAMRQALTSSEIVDLGVGPRFRVVGQGEWVESRPILFDDAGVTLSIGGKYDAVVVTEDEEVFVVDYKTTTLDDYALTKFAPQLTSYVTAIELPKSQRTGLPAYVDGIAILVFDPARFAFNPRTKNCGLYGRTRWVELTRNQQAFNDSWRALRSFLRIQYRRDRPPRATCAPCASLQQCWLPAHDAG